MKRVYVNPQSSEIECLAAAILATSGWENQEVDINVNGEPMDGAAAFSLRNRKSIWNTTEGDD